MSQFDQLKLLYKQLINLSDEEDLLVEQKAFDELDAKLSYKDTLIKQIINIKEMIKFSPEEAEEFSKLENKYTANEERNIKKFSEIRDDLAMKLKKTNNDIRLKSAYAKVKTDRQGSMLDFSE